ncbi:MAG: nitroreductase family protein [Clostridia bacterium]
MQTIFVAPIEEIVKKRISVRTYNVTEITTELKNQINAYISQLSSPFSTKVKFKLLESKTALNSAKLGTYGVIKGATDYIGATVKAEEFALEALGYEFEKLILYAASLGLGTCWLGGTFKRGEFAKAMRVKEDELFPAISPFGYAAEKRSMTDSLVRFLAKGDTRKSWSELFFQEDFSTPLTKVEAGEYAIPLEMLRLAPSASNKQPWRIVKNKQMYHFFECKSPGYSTSFGYDIQRIDMGIAACHFHLAALEYNLHGEFKQVSTQQITVPKDTLYAFSWVAE